ncbi:MAG: hypothetical protein EA397_18235 [Deltaproteobacteria bacterium]|nr:MAG: hypothetical protein EA397_18235 [Deltaproteobacteria bacterium]
MRLTLIPLVTLLSSCAPEPQTFARALVIERLDQAIGGPKAGARPGDILLENDHLRIAIYSSATPDGDVRYSMGPGLYAGSLIDADLQRADPRYRSGNGLDQFAELFPTVSMNVPAPTEPHEVRIVADGSDGGPAVVRVEAPAEPFLSLLSALWAITRVPTMRMVTDYIVEPGVPWVTIRTAVRVGPSANASDFEGVFPEGEPADGHDEPFPLMQRALETGLVMGDFYLSGGSTSVFAPGMGFDEDGLVFRAGLEGRNSFAEPFQFSWIAGTADGVSYGLLPSNGDAFVPLFTASQTAIIGGSVIGTGSGSNRFIDGSIFTYERRFFVGEGDVGSVYDHMLTAQGATTGTVRGNVFDATTMRPLSKVHVFVYPPGAEEPHSQWRTDVSVDDYLPDGSFGGKLPVGRWELVVHEEGRPSSERVEIEVREDEETSVQLLAPTPGIVTFNLRDETGQPIPGKVTFMSHQGDVRRPELGDGFIAGEPAAVAFAMYGGGHVQLPDGEYTAVASRGLEYEIDVHGPFRIDANRSHHLELVVERSVDTEGWISADLHVHANASHDSGTGPEDRVMTMICEGVEFFAATDHDVITDFAPVIENLAVEQWVQSAVGVETTTIELGHFLAFPLESDFLAEAGGARDWTGETPQEMVTGLRQQGRAAGYEPVVFVAHPRAGILGYFDQYGLNPYGGIAGQPGEVGVPLIQTPTLGLTNPLLNRENFMLEIDAMEVIGLKEAFRIRTPTQLELDTYAHFIESGDPDSEVPLAEMLKRTPEEQQDLSDGTYTLGYGRNGQLDDWFTLLNLGYRLTALANSDTHDMTTTEAGCPRNYIMSSTDDPGFIDDQEIADAVREHRVVASYGPFVQLQIEDAIIGDELVSDAETLTARVEVRAPSWMDIDGVELYENGTLIHYWEVDGRAPYRFDGTVELRPTRDAWYVAIATGSESLEPVFTPVERPIIDLQEVVVEALSGVPAVANFLETVPPMPEVFPITPFAVTNPIWLDRAGDGFSAPGLPDWLTEPRPPED